MIHALNPMPDGVSGNRFAMIAQHNDQSLVQQVLPAEEVDQ